MLKLGSHISFKAPKYLIGAVEESLNNKANAMMIYLGAPQSARRVEVSKYLIDEYKGLEKTINPEDIVIHAPYIVNPASVEKHAFATEFLIKEIERMNTFGAKYLVLHPGAHTKFTVEEGIETLVNSLKKILANTKDVEILLETMAGKGTELGASFKQMRQILDLVSSERLGLCLDTCHVWEAGYDLSNYPLFITELEKYDLVKTIKVIHVNDSKNQMGAHKDRHENLGKGFIGLKPLKDIVNGEEFKDAIKILETPWVDGKPIYDKEIRLLKD